MHSAVSSGGMHAPEKLSLGIQMFLKCRGLMELLQFFFRPGSEAMVSLSGQLERDCGQGSCADGLECFYAAKEGKIGRACTET